MPWRNRYNSKYRNNRRRSKGSSAADGIFIVLAFVALIVVYIFSGDVRTDLILILTILGFISVLIIGVISVLAWRRYKQEKALAIADIDKMDGTVFERYLANLLKNRGFKNLRVTVAEGDYGADIIGDFEGEKYAIQAKRYNVLGVGVDAIYQVLGGKEYYQCSRTMVITNYWFTRAAKQLAQRSGTILIDRKQLGEWVQDFQNS